MKTALPGWALALIVILGFALLFLLEVQVARAAAALGQWLKLRARREERRGLPIERHCRG